MPGQGDRSGCAHRSPGVHWQGLGTFPWACVPWGAERQREHVPCWGCLTHTAMPVGKEPGEGRREENQRAACEGKLRGLKPAQQEGEACPGRCC